jgi:hypothetical protein
MKHTLCVSKNYLKTLKVNSLVYNHMRLKTQLKIYKYTRLINYADLQACKIYLINILKLVARGRMMILIEKNEIVTPQQKEQY